MMTLLEAIQARHSVRYYTGQPLTDADAQALQEKIDQVNREGRLHIQLIRNERKAFLGPFARYGKFRNVTGNKDLTDEQVLKMAELLDEVSPKGVFKDLTADIRAQLGASKRG